MNAETKSDPLSRNVLLTLLVLCMIGVAAVVYLAVRPPERPPETIITLVETQDVQKADVNILQVTDAIDDPAAVAAEGRRYKVLVVDEAREGSSGIARIGGLVTFVPDTRKGDVAVIEVTRLKRSTADAILIERLETGRAVPPVEPRTHAAGARRETAPSEMVGRTFRGTVVDTGREGDGIVKVDGKVVFVRGASLGEHVEFVVAEDAGRFARADVVTKSDVPYETAAAPPAESVPVQDDKVQPVKVGEEHEVIVTEADRRNPGMDGVARIENFVIFVPGTKVGDRVRIRITEVRSRSAASEVMERLDTASPLP